jgi:hypothetical protein
MFSIFPLNPWIFPLTLSTPLVERGVLWEALSGAGLPTHFEQKGGRN